jgi:hypothetical protein
VRVTSRDIAARTYWFKPRLTRGAKMYFLDPLDRLRIERGSEHLYRLGARSVAEFLAEGIASGDDITSLLDRLQRYQHYDPAILRAVGGDRFPRRLRAVPR